MVYLVPTLHFEPCLGQSDRAQLGWRLHALMPRMLPGPLEQTGQKGAAGAVEMRMRAPIHPP